VPTDRRRALTDRTSNLRARNGAGRAARLIALMVLAAPLAPAGAQTPDSLGVGDWPLSAGDTWLYESRRIETTAPGRTEVVEDSVVVRVLAAHDVDGARLALVERRRSGSAAEIEYQRLAGGALTVVDDPERFGRLLAGASAEPDDPRAAIVFPLRDGQRWGAAEMLARGDGLYISTVEAAQVVRLPGGSIAAFPVRFRTLPDQVTSWYAPGLGLVRWEYVHHGLEERETWELLDFRHAAADTAALTAYLERRLLDVLSRDGFWSRRTALAGDAALRAGLGDLAIEEDAEDVDGVRRLRLVGGRGRIAIERLPDGPGRAWIVTIGDRERLWHRFEFAADWPEGAGAGLSTLLVDVRGELARAIVERDAGERDAAIARVDRAATLLAGALNDRISVATVDSSLSDLARTRLRADAGAAALVTRYGRRVRLDADGLRADLEPCGEGLLMTIRYESPERTRIGAAPRLLVPGRAPHVVADPEEEPSLSPCRLLAADWAPERPGAESLFLCTDRPGGAPRVELYALDAAATPLIWSRTLPGGSARLTGPDLTLELDFERPDPAGSGVQRWREYWGPPPADTDLELYPRPIRRERLDLPEAAAPTSRP
jgi:hypothetical protein